MLYKVNILPKRMQKASLSEPEAMVFACWVLNLPWSIPTFELLWQQPGESSEICLSHISFEDKATNAFHQHFPLAIEIVCQERWCGSEQDDERDI
jgi:hypothetical protein